MKNKKFALVTAFLVFLMACSNTNYIVNINNYNFIYLSFYDEDIRQVSKKELKPKTLHFYFKFLKYVKWVFALSYKYINKLNYNYINDLRCLQ